VPLERSQRIAIVRGATSTSLDIGPKDYFVLSRIEGRPTVGEVLDTSGLPSGQTREILSRLLDLGAIEKVQAPAPAIRNGGGSSGVVRARAANRRRRTLVEGLAKKVRNTPTVEMPAARAPAPAKEEEAAPPPPPPPPPFSLPPVGVDDDRVDPDLGIAVDEQRKLLALADRAEELTPFEILGLHPTNDKSVIRQAFRDASRRFHPDAYHGRQLGSFGERLESLFSAAKDSVKRLGDDTVRAPLVEAYEAKRDAARAAEAQRQSRMDAAKAAAEEIRAKRVRDAAAERRAIRTRNRASAQRDRVIANLTHRAAQHVQDAERAELAGNLPAAANHYRLSLRVNPDQPDVKEKWEAVRTKARVIRAKEAFSRGNAYLELGQSEEALPLLVEAADADPTIEHLALAADLLRTVDAPRARELAMAALNALSLEGSQEAAPKKKPRTTQQMVELHLMLGRAFLSAGQKKTAAVQAQLAQRLAPEDPQVRALLNSAKVK